MLRFWSRSTRSSTPTWSIVGVRVKSGSVAGVDSGVFLAIMFGGE